MAIDIEEEYKNLGVKYATAPFSAQSTINITKQFLADFADMIRREQKNLDRYEFEKFGKLLNGLIEINKAEKE